jgi:hypothetical protein
MPALYFSGAQVTEMVIRRPPPAKYLPFKQRR